MLVSVKNALSALSGQGTNNPKKMGKHDHFWKMKPELKVHKWVFNYDGKVDEDLYKLQTSHLSNALLIDDYDPMLDVDTYSITFQDKLKWPNKGELISGSFIARAMTEAVYGACNFHAEDVDIYFHTKEDAKEFVELNGMWGFDFDNPVCAYGNGNGDGIAYNLIWGIEYRDPANLVSRFDIRACAIAVDPNTMLVHAVRGAVDDASCNKIVFNPVPRGVSIRRLVKYVEKGFQIDPHQRLFFSELVRSNLYSTELELITGAY